MADALGFATANREPANAVCVHRLVSGGVAMARKCRGEVVDPSEIQVFHVLNRTVRRCFLFGQDPLTGKNYDHRKELIEGWLRQFAGCFGIDLLSFAILSSHYHLMLRSRPDVVASWDDTEVARRWLMICPDRKQQDGSPCEPTEPELDTIRNCRETLAEIRSRLSNISWWMRLLDQRIARYCNDEDGATGRFFEDRFKSIPLIDEEAVTACAVYIDLNLIRACLAETVEMSDHTSGQLRARAWQDKVGASTPETDEMSSQAGASTFDSADSVDAFLAPVCVSECSDQPGPMVSRTGKRCSDKGFLQMSDQAYLELLDWTARQTAAGKPGRTSDQSPPILVRLGLAPSVWLKMVAEFGRLFPTMAGLPHHVELVRSRKLGLRFHVPPAARELFYQSA
jgi:hypothetical protein